MENHYQLLGIDQQASSEAVAEAYARQRELYRPERVGGIDEELRLRAERRTAQLDQAYAILSDPAQRRLYDVELADRRAQPVGHAQRTGVTRREVLISAGGALVGLLLIAVVWVFAGRSAETPLPPIGEINRPAPDFTLPGLNGGTIKLSDYRGKVVLVNFWGTWCEPCKEETPALQAAYQEMQQQGLEIIGINLYSQESGGDKAVREFLGPYKVTYPIALDSAGEIARAFQISPIPTSYFVDPSGNIRFVKVGTLRTAEVRTLFERLQSRAAVQP